MTTFRATKAVHSFKALLPKKVEPVNKLAESALCQNKSKLFNARVARAGRTAAKREADEAARAAAAAAAIPIPEEKPRPPSARQLRQASMRVVEAELDASLAVELRELERGLASLQHGGAAHDVSQRDAAASYDRRHRDLAAAARREMVAMLAHPGIDHGRSQTRGSDIRRATESRLAGLRQNRYRWVDVESGGGGVTIGF